MFTPASPAAGGRIALTRAQNPEYDSRSVSDDHPDALRKGYTPLHAAAEAAAWSKSANGVRLLLDKGAKVEARTEDCWTPLHAAASSGAKEAVELLLNRGADHRSQTRSGETPLHLAAELHLVKEADDAPPSVSKQKLEAVQALVRHGAKWDVKDEAGRTPLRSYALSWARYRVGHRMPDGVEFARTCGVDLPALLNAATENLVEESREMRHRRGLSHMTDDEPDSVDTRAYEDTRNAVEVLLDRGADVNALAADGRAAIHIATATSVLSVVEFLRDRGADVNRSDASGNTPLHCLALRDGGLFGSPAAIAQFLLDRGADVMARNTDGGTPLHSAAHRDGYEMAEFLLRYRADVDAGDKNGGTPLHRAAYENSTSVAKQLLDHGADFAAEDQRAETPLHAAIRGDAWEVAELLLERGADPKAIKEYGSEGLESGTSIENRIGTGKMRRFARIEKGLFSALNDGLTEVARRRGWAEGVRVLERIQACVDHWGMGSYSGTRPSKGEGFYGHLEMLMREERELWWHLQDLGIDELQPLMWELRDGSLRDPERWLERMC